MFACRAIASPPTILIISERVGQQAFGSGSFSIAEVESANDLQAWKILQGSSTGRLCGAVPFEFQHRLSLTALSIPGVSPSAELAEARAQFSLLSPCSDSFSGLREPGLPSDHGGHHLANHRATHCF